MTKRTEQEYDFMEGGKHRNKREVHSLKTAFLRKPYQYTSAETKDDTQEKLHEYDFLL